MAYSTLMDMLVFFCSMSLYSVSLIRHKEGFELKWQLTKISLPIFACDILCFWAGNTLYSGL